MKRIENLYLFFSLSNSEGSVPHSDFNDGNNLRTPALQWTSVLRLTIWRIVVDLSLSGVTFVT